MRAQVLASALALLASAATAQSTIPNPPFASTWSSSAGTRGFWFQTPVPLAIRGLRVPDEAAKGQQFVAVYRMSAAPPVYSASRPENPVFYMGGVPSLAIIPCSLLFQPGEFFGVLGACGDSSGATMYNSYSAVGPFQTTLMGQPITLSRLILQASLKATAGVGALSSSANPISRVEVYIAGANVARAGDYGQGKTLFGSLAPALTTASLPILGAMGGLDFKPNDAAASAAILTLGVGRLQIPLPFGDLLVAPPFYATFVLPGLGGGLNLPIPNDQALLGAGPLDFQGFGLLPAGLATSNGTEWFLGL